MRKKEAPIKYIEWLNILDNSYAFFPAWAGRDGSVRGNFNFLLPSPPLERYGRRHSLILDEQIEIHIDFGSSVLNVGNEDYYRNCRQDPGAGVCDCSPE
jgi:hypothetical protein